MASELFHPSSPGSGSRGRQPCVALTKCSLGGVWAGVCVCVEVCVCERETERFSILKPGLPPSHPLGGGPVFSITLPTRTQRMETRRIGFPRPPPQLGSCLT